MFDAHEDLAKPAVRHGNCNTEAKTLQRFKDLGRPMRTCGLLTRRHHQSSPYPGNKPAAAPCADRVPRSDITGANVGKIAAVVDPRPMVQTIALACGDIG